MACHASYRSEQIGQEEPPIATSINLFRYCYIQCLAYHRKFLRRIRGNVRRPVPRLKAMNKFRLPPGFSGRPESRGRRPSGPFSQKRSFAYTLQFRRWDDFHRAKLQTLAHFGGVERRPCNRPKNGYSKSASPPQHGGPPCPNVRGCLT